MVVRREGEEKFVQQESVKDMRVHRIIHAKKRNRTIINEQVATGGVSGATRDSG